MGARPDPAGPPPRPMRLRDVAVLPFQVGAVVAAYVVVSALWLVDWALFRGGR